MSKSNIEVTFKKMEEILKNYEIKNMNEWENVNADIIITDPPFGIEFNGKGGNYNRKKENVVEGYCEWNINEYERKTKELLECIKKNLNENGQALIFSGWNNSNIIHNEINKMDGIKLNGKLYWTYNFAPACKLRPAHNVYEIFWITKNDKYYYNNRCNTHHCKKGEPNLTTLMFKRDYKINMPKYPTRLPYELLQSLIKHFTRENDLIFDPLGGSGIIGIVAYNNKRRFRIGDVNKNGKLVFEHLIKYYYDYKKMLEVTIEGIE